MKIEKIRNYKRIAILILGILFILTIFYVASQSVPDFYTNSKLGIFAFIALDILVIFWIIYEISEINLLHSGQLGAGLAFILAGVYLFAFRVLITGLGQLDLPRFQPLTSFLMRPPILTSAQAINLVLIAIGVYIISRIFKKVR